MEVSNFFIGLGAQKAGTTWLDDYLRAHPEVSLSPLKEVHYFDSLWIDSCGRFDKYFYKQLRQSLNSLDPDKQGVDELNSDAFYKSIALHVRSQMSQQKNYKYWYPLYFSMLCNTSKIFGEITPSYSMLEAEHFANIDSIYKNTKYIFLMRDPVERFWSQVRFFYKNKSDSSLYEAFEQHLADPRFYLRSDYKRTLEALFSVVPRERVCLEFYENIFGLNGESYVRKITNFLGITYLQPDLGKQVNVSNSLDLPEDLGERAEEYFAEVYSYVRDVIAEEDIPSTWRR